MSLNLDFLEINTLPSIEDDASAITMKTVATPVDMVEPGHTRSKISRCIITGFPSSCDSKLLRPETWFKPESLQIWCGQFEECPKTERLHFHIYVEFKNEGRQRFETIRKRIEQVTGKPGDVKSAKKASGKQRQGAVNYVLKPEDRFHGTDCFIWERNKFTCQYKPFEKSKKNSREDVIEEQVNYIESKPKHWTWNQILHESDVSKKLLAACSWGPKYHAGRHEQAPIRLIKDVIIMYGCGGTGKTTLAQNWDIRDNEDFHERYYKRNSDDGKFWGGGRTAYRGQRIIHLEEFCGQETAANLKEICDLNKQGPNVNVKNGGGQLNHDTVIITSNHHPSAWYRQLFKQDNKQWTPVCRRFTKVFFFPELRPDGTRNIPDSENPPWYEDQTDTFLDKEFQASYDKAVQHAADYWPLKEETPGFYDPNHNM